MDWLQDSSTNNRISLRFFSLITFQDTMTLKNQAIQAIDVQDDPLYVNCFWWFGDIGLCYAITEDVMK